MTLTAGDPLWPHFAPLWTDLRAISPGLLLAGGYALFLKQRWLIAHTGYLLLEDGGYMLLEDGGRWLLEDSPSSLISLDRWIESAPRVTNDLDFVVDVEIIASQHDQQSYDDTLKRHGYRVVPQNSLWQFVKQNTAGHELKIDFHASPPATARNDLRVESRRVKPNPSLAQVGIHGRENAEAIGCELHPFQFTIDDLEIATPNSVTLSIMKLVAAHEKREKSLDPARTPEERNTLEAESRKHARDVFRVIAMLTREESDLAPQIIAKLRATDSFQAAANAFRSMFVNAEQWATPVVADMWRPTDFQLIQSVLANWFSSTVQ